MNKVFLNGQTILKLSSVCLYADSIHTEKHAYEDLIYSLKHNHDLLDENLHALYNFLIEAVSHGDGTIRFEDIGVYSKFKKINTKYAIVIKNNKLDYLKKESLKTQLIEVYKNLIQECVKNNWNPIIELHDRELEDTTQTTLITEIPQLIPSPKTPYSNVMQFKQKRRDELLRFRQCANSFQSAITIAESKAHVLDIMHQYRDDLELSLFDLTRVAGESRMRTSISSTGTLLEAKNPALINSFISRKATVGRITGNNIGAPLAGTILGGVLGVGMAVGGAYLNAREKIKNSKVAYILHADKKTILNLNDNFIEWQISQEEKKTSKENLTFVHNLEKRNRKEEIQRRKQQKTKYKLHLIGDSYAIANKNKEAIKVYSDIISLQLSDYSTYKKRGYQYALVQQLEKSLSDFNKSISLNDSDAQTYNYRSAVKIFLRQEDAALSDIMKAIQLNPSIINELTDQQKKIINTRK
ncbi:DUF6236 family protein [Aquimarina sediminis]|uniref:DUF6236 family protein n=1 Tax=Aquimarina sediminis TaxID=2070536 RepID=UPI000CA03EE2|nr:DUF6236 family protein [Aquimarina sediminis]